MSLFLVCVGLGLVYLGVGNRQGQLARVIAKKHPKKPASHVHH